MVTKDLLLQLLQKFEGLDPSVPTTFSQQELELLRHVVWVAFCMEREKEGVARVAEVMGGLGEKRK